MSFGFFGSDVVLSGVVVLGVVDEVAGVVDVGVLAEVEVGVVVGDVASVVVGVVDGVVGDVGGVVDDGVVDDDVVDDGVVDDGVVDDGVVDDGVVVGSVEEVVVGSLVVLSPFESSISRFNLDAGKLADGLSTCSPPSSRRNKNKRTILYRHTLLLLR